MSQSLREEFRLSALTLSYPVPDHFVTAQWKWPRCLYLLWRGLWLMWHVAITVASIINFRDKKADSDRQGAKWLIYYSHVTFLFTILACAADFLGVLCARRSTDAEPKNKPEGEPGSSRKEKEEILFHGEFIVLEGLKEPTTPCFSKLTWLLYNIINSSNILGTAWFWAVVYDSHTYGVDMVAHVVNSVFVVTNLLVSAAPVRMLHAIYPVTYTALYIVFTVAYHEAGGTDVTGRDTIYKELDWSDAHPTAVTVVVGLLVVLPLLHCGLVFALFTFRVYLHSKFNSAYLMPEPRSESGVRGVRYKGGMEAAGSSSGGHPVNQDSKATTKV